MKSAAVLIGVVGTATFYAAIDWSGITQFVTAIGVIIAAILSYLANKSAKDAANKSESAEKKVDSVDKKVEKVQEQSNGMTSQLADVTRMAALFEGELKGREAQKAESKSDAVEAKELKLEEHVAAKQDAKELRQESKDLAAKVEEVKATGEDTNKVVKGEKPDTDTEVVDRNPVTGEYKSPPKPKG